MDDLERVYLQYVSERYPSPTQQQLLDFETSLNIKLPDDFVNFLLRFNGGIFTSNRFPLPLVNGGVDELHQIGGVGKELGAAELGSSGRFSPAIFSENDPILVLPIGYTLMGNLLYLMLGENAGAIGAKIAWEDEYCYLAPNIFEFLLTLGPVTDD